MLVPFHLSSSSSFAAAASSAVAFTDTSGGVPLPFSELSCVCNLWRCYLVLVISTSPRQTLGSGAKKTFFRRCYI